MDRDTPYLRDVLSGIVLLCSLVTTGCNKDTSTGITKEGKIAEEANAAQNATGNSETEVDAPPSELGVPLPADNPLSGTETSPVPARKPTPDDSRLDARSLTEQLRRSIRIEGDGSQGTTTKYVFSSPNNKTLTYPYTRLRLLMTNDSSFDISFEDQSVYVESRSNHEDCRGLVTRFRQNWDTTLAKIGSDEAGYQYGYGLSDTEHRGRYRTPAIMFSNFSGSIKASMDFGGSFSLDDFWDESIPVKCEKQSRCVWRVTVRLTSTHRDDADDVYFILPAMAVSIAGERQRFRAVLELERDEPSHLIVAATHLYSLRVESLRELVLDDNKTVSERIFGLNWLVEQDATALGTIVERLLADETPPALREATLILAALTDTSGAEQAVHAHLQAHTDQSGSLAPYSLERSDYSGPYRDLLRYLARKNYHPAIKDLIAWASAGKDASFAGKDSALEALALTSLPEAQEFLLNPGEVFSGLNHRVWCESLAVSGTPLSIAKLEELVAATDSSPNTPRNQAIHALSQIADARLLPLFRSLKNDQWENLDASLRTSVLVALLKTAPAQYESEVIELLKQAAAEKFSNYNPPAVVQALRSVQPQSLISSVTRLAEAGSVAAILALEGWEHEAVRNTLTKLSASTDEKLAEPATESLRSGENSSQEEFLKSVLLKSGSETGRKLAANLELANVNEIIAALWPLRADKSLGDLAKAAIYSLPLQKEWGRRMIREFADSGKGDSSLPDYLFDQGWKDEAMAPELLEALEKVEATEEGRPYHLIRILRHLTDWEAGPENFREFVARDEGRKWHPEFAKWFADHRSLAPSNDEVQTFRTWTSRDGRQIEGAIRSVREGRVSIQRKADSKQFTVPLTSLSDEDQQWIERNHQSHGQSIEQ